MIRSRSLALMLNLVLALFAFGASTATAQTTLPGGNVFGVFTLAGSPYIVQGDITVPATTTLTIQAGVELRFPFGDAMGAGVDTSRTELTVHGSLVVQGTAAEPVLMHADGSPSAGAWYGVRIASDAQAADVDHLQLQHAWRAFETATPGAVTQVDHLSVDRCTSTGLHVDGGAADFNDVTVTNCSSFGVYVANGTPTLNRLRAENTRYGVFVGDKAGASIHNAVIRDQTNYGVYARMSATSAADVTVLHSTVYNTDFGVFLLAEAGTLFDTVVRNSILVNNASFGAFRSGTEGRLEVTYSDAWGNGTDLMGTVGGEGNLSADPEFVDAVEGDLHVMGGSATVDSATDVGALADDHDGLSRPQDGDGVGGATHDMGAYEFVLIPECGNGVPEPGEDCDDGNEEDGDGCSALCESEDVADAGLPTDDAGFPVGDGGSPAEDAGNLADDAGPPGGDAGLPPDDGGVIVADAGNGMDDGGPSVDDAGTPVDDGGLTVDDAGTPLNDAGLTVEDAGTPVDDGGPLVADAGTSNNDGGLADDDAGTPTEEDPPVTGSDDPVECGCSSVALGTSWKGSGEIALAFVLVLFGRRRRST